MALVTNPAEVSRVLDEMVRAIVERYEPVEVILFGSRARGGADEGSDVDLLVVLPDARHTRQSGVEMLRFLRDYPLALDLLVTSYSKMRRLSLVIGTVHHEARKKGKVLYAAYVRLHK